jgi:hypothetical protein
MLDLEFKKGSIEEMPGLNKEGRKERPMSSYRPMDRSRQIKPILQNVSSESLHGKKITKDSAKTN